MRGILIAGCGITISTILFIILTPLILLIMFMRFLTKKLIVPKN